MATTTNLIDEDYIDMEITSSSSSDLFGCAFNSPPPPPPPLPPPSPTQQSSKEFEFQMSSSDPFFPADELFYKGKLLPLHLPPRLQMVQKIIQSSDTQEDDEEEAFEDTFTIIPFSSSTAPCTNTNTPLESSPSESRRVSCELNPDEYLSQWADEVRVFINGGGGGGGGTLPKIKSWSWKLKQSSLGRKLKASRAYLKSLFNNNNSSTKSSEESTTPTPTFTTSSPCNESIKNGDKNGRYQKLSTLMKSIENEIMAEAAAAAAASGHNSNNSSHRKSFSGVIQRHSGAKSMSTSTSSSGSTSSSSSSSSFSLSSNGSHDLQFLKRSSSSANSDLESSIQGAIAHCKQSSEQRLFSASYRSKTLTQNGTFPCCSSRIAV